MKPVSIRVCIVGVGNCASSLVQGIYYCRTKGVQEAVGVARWDVGGILPGDLEIVAAFDVDRRKVGFDVSQAVYADPNCTPALLPSLPRIGTTVCAGPLLDGLSRKASPRANCRTVEPMSGNTADEDTVIRVLRDSGTEVVVNYLPTGSEEATRFYTSCALKAGAAFVNCIPAFIASDPKWAQRFHESNLPIIGDDIKSQFGATIVHRALADLCRTRGVQLDRTYQLNVGGNSDFANMLDRDRLGSKAISKTEAVQSVAATSLTTDDVHISPSDFVPWLRDNKVAYIRLEGRLFGGPAFQLEARLSVQDSPNSAGIVIDAVRCAKLALQRGIGGPLLSASACFCKRPPMQLEDSIARQQLEAWITGAKDGL